MSQNQEQLPPEERWNAEQQDFQRRQQQEAGQYAEWLANKDTVRDSSSSSFSKGDRLFWWVLGLILVGAIVAMLLLGC